MKVYDKGKLRKDVWDLIFANIRFDIVQHDMKAEIGAATIGERRFVELLKKYGLESLEAHKQALFEATRRMMEAEIAKIPNGRYSGEGYVYYDGKNEGSKYTIRVDIDVADKHIKFDYSRTDAQTNGFVNGTYTSSASATILTLLQMVNRTSRTTGHGAADRDRDPGRHAAQRRLPEGDHLRQSPVPAEPRCDPARARAGDASASPPAGTTCCARSPPESIRNNDKYVDIGSWASKGARAMRGTDGYDHIGMIDASGGLLDQDYEMFEQQTPHRLIRHELLQDSAAGPVARRLGVETIFEIGADDTQMVTFGDGDFEPAFGLFGGSDAGLNFIRLKYPDGHE